jgi:hypothetical protein
MHSNISLISLHHLWPSPTGGAQYIGGTGWRLLQNIFSVLTIPTRLAATGHNIAGNNWPIVSKTIDRRQPRIGGYFGLSANLRIFHEIKIQASSDLITTAQSCRVQKYE